MLNLSKSKYCNAVQCPKMLWMKKNKPESFDASVMNEQVLETGNEVGDLAMGIFGDFTEVPFGDLTDMLRVTEELIQQDVSNIAEASFAYNGLFCSVDIFKVTGDKEAEIYEVKSSTSVHDIYLHDVAYQYYVLSGLGWNVTKACLVHVDNTYVRHGELELDKLFKIEDLTDIAREKQVEVGSNVAFLEEYMQQNDEPEKEIGLHCTNPYVCGFWKYCTRNLPVPNVFDIGGMMNKTKFKLYNSGVVSFEDVEKNKSGNANQMLQIAHELHDMEPHIDKKAISECMGKLSYPLYFLDFESFQPAVPIYDDSKPFQQIVFQYSLHYIEKEGGELKHKEYLAYPGEDPRRGVAEQLCRDIPKDVCTTAYNMGFEKGRIKELAELYPDLAEHLMNIYDNIQDLMVPFQKKWYYTKAMHGSYSIKYVLPALYPDDPELDYHNLDGVHNGTEASATFAQMAKMNPEELELSRKNLLKYCGLDTNAMVKVWEKLMEVSV